ncbi:MAG: hypothetical protein P1Q69_05530 [Candidatus Thorarchaeota archaeon]|nr:hypothetical protein [Candidatus Thorarchaeota archaeon]
MSELEILQNGFVAFLDGLWWGLRDNTGPLSMYEGYERGFRQFGSEQAERDGGNGAEAAAGIASKIMNAIGMKTEVNGSEVSVKECPVWNRILEKGLEFAFHVEEICWTPLLEGIGEKTGVKPVMLSSLRLNHIAKAKIDYKKNKAKGALEKGAIVQEDFDRQDTKLSLEATQIPKVGKYRFE